MQDAERPLHLRLWEANRDLVEGCCSDIFVDQLIAGTLPDEAFRRYLAQDVLFLEGHLAANARAAVAATADGDRELAEVFVRAVQSTVPELVRQVQSAVRLGVDFGEKKPLPATQRFSTFFEKVAEIDGARMSVVAMTPCLRLYAHLGKEAMERLGDMPADHRYRSWISTYSSPGIEQMAAEWEIRLDAIRVDAARAQEVYRQALVLEREFFAAALQVD